MEKSQESSQVPCEVWFEEFIEACDYVFNVSLAADDLDACKTVGDLENIIYDQIELGVLPNQSRNRIIQNTLRLINSRLDGTTRLITTDDLDQPFVELCVDISSKHWVRSFDIIQSVINAPLPKVTMKKWAWLLSLILWIGSGVLAIWLGVVWGVWDGIGSGFLLILFVAYITHILPKKKPKGSITLRDAIDQYIDHIEQCHKGLSFVEVQYRVRQLYASWLNTGEAESPNNNTEVDSIKAETPFDLPLR